jgi:lipopolysaccharide/colanic/teichoic acid biosynthesis glycosyltransferase
VLLVALGPLLAACAVAVKLGSRGPVLFHQRRVGLDGDEFDVLKFRSMRLTGDGVPGFLPPDGMAPGGVEGEDRRTAVGAWMRRYCLDELPQLINVVRGEMSLVGPRPERPEFVALFAPRVARYGDRHRVKAGMTGWAQVHGLRGQTSLAERVAFDNYYIRNWSLGLDLKILLLTVVAIFAPEGSDVPGRARRRWLLPVAGATQGEGPDGPHPSAIVLRRPGTTPAPAGGPERRIPRSMESRDT